MGLGLGVGGERREASRRCGAVPAGPLAPACLGAGVGVGVRVGVGAGQGLG